MNDSFIPNRENLAWAAGLFDGEGTIYSNSRLILLAVGQVDREVLDEFHTAVGNIGRVSGPYTSSNPNAQLSYRYTASKYETVQAVIAMLWPFLKTVKRKQAEKALKNYVSIPRRPSELKHLTQIKNGRWAIQRRIDGRLFKYGSYPTLEEAQKRRDELFYSIKQIATPLWNLL